MRKNILTKSVVAASTMALALTALCGCGASKPKLHLYNWVDYIDPVIAKEFEKQFNCKLVTDTFNSNESMFAKLKAGASGYDIVFPSSYMVPHLRDQGFIQELDISRLPNLANIDHTYDRIVADPSFHISVPYMISNAGIAYNTKRCPDFEPTWKMFGNAKYAHSCTLLDDMRETIGAALKTLGYSLNTTDEAEVTAASDLVIEWIKNIAKFDSEFYRHSIASGHFVFVHGYNGDLRQAIDENNDIAYALPKEGVSIACDEMVIPKTAKNPDLAYAFINFVHAPEIAARNMEYNYSLCPNSACYGHLSEKVKNDPSIFIPDEIMAKSEAIRDLGEKNAIYVKAWNRIKAAAQ